MSQAPGDIVDGGEDQVFVQEVSLGLGKCSVACIGVVNDGTALVHQIGELLVGGNQILLVAGGAIVHNACDVGHVAAVISIVVVNDDLGQEVDGIAEVSAPAHVDEALQLGSHDFLHGGGHEGVDIQHDEVIAEAVGEALLQHGCAVQSGGGAGQNVVGAVNREGDTNGAQLFHGLLLQLGDVAVVGAQALHGLAIVSLAVQTHLLGHQVGIVGAVRGVAQALHGEEVVLTLQGIDGVVTGEELVQHHALGEALTERLVGNGLVPVLIGGAVGVLLVVVEDEAIAELLGTLLAQLLIVLIGRIGLNGGDVALAQVHLVQLAVLIQLQADGTVADHGDGEALKAADVGSIVVVGVGDVALGVALDVLLHHIGSVVPHGGVVAAPEAIDTQLLDQSRSHGVEAVVGGNGIKVGAGAGAGEYQSVIIRSLNAHTGGQHVLVGHVSSSVTGFLGQLVVLVSTHNGIVGHGGVVGLVLDGVHHPFKTNQEVLAGQVSFHLTVAIHPVHVVPQVEGPDSSILIVLPAGSDGGHHLAVAVKAQQAVPQVGDHVGIFSLLGIQHVPAFQLTVAALKGDEFLQGGSAGGVGGSSAAGGSTIAGVVGLFAAGCQQAGGTHSTCTLQEGAAIKIEAHWMILPDLARTEPRVFPFPKRSEAVCLSKKCTGKTKVTPRFILALY